MSVNERQRELDRFIAKYFPEPVPDLRGNGRAHAAVSELEDEEIISLCRKARNAAKFSDLFDRGNVYVHHGGDDSAADQALMCMLAYYAKDPNQLERLFSMSALAKRDKWRKRADYRRRTINKALETVAEQYTPPNRNRNRHLMVDSDDYDSAEEPSRLTSVSLHDLPEPGGRDYLVKNLVVRLWPVLLHGKGGVAKSLLALSLAQALADPEVTEWLGWEIATCNVMFLDLELNQEEQARRGYQLARGDGRECPPKGLRYMTTFGVPPKRRKNLYRDVLTECKAHDVEVLIIDSTGIAMRGVQGDTGDYNDVIDFFEEIVMEFAGEGITVILIDHERRVQPGEKRQRLGAFGSVFKENLSRSQIQVEFVAQDREEHSLIVRLRHKKSNFGELAEPFGAKLTFSAKQIMVAYEELSDADRAEEETITAKERVLAALRASDDETAWPEDLLEKTGLALGTLKNMLSVLRKEELVEYTGRVENRSREVRLVNRNRHSPFKGDGDDYDSGEALWDGAL